MNADAKALAASFDLEKLTPGFYDNPYPTYRALRENEPVKRLRNGTVFLTRYDDLVTTYKNTKSFSSDKKREFAPKYGAAPLERAKTAYRSQPASMAAMNASAVSYTHLTLPTKRIV